MHAAHAQLKSTDEAFEAGLNLIIQGVPQG